MSPNRRPPALAPWRQVNESMMAGPGANRAARRAAKKKVASGKKKKSKM